MRIYSLSIVHRMMHMWVLSSMRYKEKRRVRAPRFDDDERVARNREGGNAKKKTRKKRGDDVWGVDVTIGVDCPELNQVE